MTHLRIKGLEMQNNTS